MFLKNILQKCKNKILDFKFNFRTEAKNKVLREVRTLANLESPYIVRYFHSWFEKHSYEWQKGIDKEKLLKQNDEAGNDFSFSTTQISSFNSNTNTMSTTNTFNKRRLLSNSNKFDNSSSSISIVFENSHEQIIELDEDNESIENINKFDSDAEKTNDIALYFYIQMELCQRETLRDWLEKFKYENRGRVQILTIFDQILNAIFYIHSKGLIHRDLKVNIQERNL